jgi:hypothetical protein
MTYTITGAQFSNDKNTAVIVTTTEMGAVFIDLVGDNNPEARAAFEKWVAKGNEAASYRAPPTAPKDAITDLKERVAALEEKTK